MKKLIPFFLVMLGFVLGTSCNSQNNPSPPKAKTASSKPFQVPVDSYFTGTETINSTNGPTSITRNMLQDKKGNIWLATWEGIIRYDGNSFTNYTNKHKLSRFRAFAILEDSKGMLWFATVGAGVFRFDGESFTQFTTKEGLPNDRTTFLGEDSHGYIWVGSEGGASRFDGDAITNYTTKDGLLDNDVNDVLEDQTGRYWIATRGEACFFDASPNESGGWREKFTRIVKEDGTPFTNVRCIIEDRNGNIWLGGNNGLWRYTPDSSKGSFTQYTKRFVGYIYEDRQGNIWTSSESDIRQIWVLSRYNVKTLLDEKVSPIEIKSEEGMYFGIMEDDKGHIWWGTLNGVYRYDGEAFEDFKASGDGE